jgi:hypothetical protein
MLAGNTIFSRVWVRRLAHFLLGAILSHFLVVFLSRFVYDSEIAYYLVRLLVAPALFLSAFTASWEAWGWAIVLGVLSVAVFWGLVAMAIGWGWEKWGPKRKV